MLGTINLALIRNYMPPIYEYYCSTIECPENTGHFPTSHRIIEKLVKMDEHPDCDVCHCKLIKVTSAPRGRVTGSRNPVKQ